MRFHHGAACWLHLTPVGSTDLIPSWATQERPAPAPPPHYRTFFLADGSQMTLQLRKGFGAESTGGTGAALWEAGLVMCDYVRTHEVLFSGKRILELGAGNGLLGVVLAKLADPPASITLTDHHPKVLSLMEQNLGLNGVCVHHDWLPCLRHSSSSEGPVLVGGNDPECGSDTDWRDLGFSCGCCGTTGLGHEGAGQDFVPGKRVVRTLMLDWEICQRELAEREGCGGEAPVAASVERGSQGGLSDLERLGTVDVIIGADVTYSPELCTAWLCTVKHLLSQSAAGVALLAASLRSHETFEHLQNEIKRFGLACRKIVHFRVPVQRDAPSCVRASDGGEGERVGAEGCAMFGDREISSELGILSLDAGVAVDAPSRSAREEEGSNGGVGITSHEDSTLMEKYPSLFVASEIYLFVLRLPGQ